MPFPHLWWRRGFSPAWRLRRQQGCLGKAAAGCRSPSGCQVFDRFRTKFQDEPSFCGWFEVQGGRRVCDRGRFLEAAVAPVVLEALFEHPGTGRGSFGRLNTT
jgi:hypothetical protein